MTKADIVNKIAEKTEIPKAQVQNWVDATLACIAAGLQDGDEVVLQKFGAFRLRTAKARMARNPSTGAAVNVPERTKVVFKASKELLG
jgi:DNA-binding protein HU-beta